MMNNIFLNLLLSIGSMNSISSKPDLKIVYKIQVDSNYTQKLDKFSFSVYTIIMNNETTTSIYYPKKRSQSVRMNAIMSIDSLKPYHFYSKYDKLVWFGFGHSTQIDSIIEIKPQSFIIIESKFCININNINRGCKRNCPIFFEDWLVASKNNAEMLEQTLNLRNRSYPDLWNSSFIKMRYSFEFDLKKMIISNSDMELTDVFGKTKW